MQARKALADIPARAIKDIKKRLTEKSQPISFLFGYKTEFFYRKFLLSI